MAYKSQVTNKYMGSSFAGRVNPGRENELTQLAKSLDQFSDALPRGVAAYKGNKVEEAEERLEYLKATMSPEELNAHILKGEDPILANKWAVSVVDGQIGRFEASQVIQNIVANQSQYDFQKETRREFYNKFMPDIASKSSAYQNGFGVHFNDWQASDLLQDADARAKFRQKSKIEAGVSFLRTAQYENMDEFWQYVGSLGSQLPSTDGKTNYFFSAQDQNTTAIAFARQIMQTATKEEHFELARNILESDRGKAANGTQLGALSDTGRQDVADLLQDIDGAEYRFVTQARTLEAYQEEVAADEIFARAFDPDKLNDFAFQQSIIEELKQVDERFIPIYKQLIDVNRTVTTNPDVLRTFRKQVAQGNFAGDYLAFLEEAYSRGIPDEDIPSLRQEWALANDDEFKGRPKIYETNTTYVRGTTNIKNVVRGVYSTATDFGMFEDPNAIDAMINAEEFVIDSIIAFEAEARDDGRTLTDADRRAFMADLKDFVKTVFEDRGGTKITDPEALKDTAPNVVDMFTDLQINENTISNVLDTFNSAAEALTNYVPFEETDNAQVPAVADEYIKDAAPEIAKGLMKTMPQYLIDNMDSFISAISVPQLMQLAETYKMTPNQFKEVLAEMVKQSGQS